MGDQIKVEILEDGQIIFETDKISGKNHASADDFVNEIEKLAGNLFIKEKKKTMHHNASSKYRVHAH